MPTASRNPRKTGPLPNSYFRDEERWLTRGWCLKARRGSWVPVVVGLQDHARLHAKLESVKAHFPQRTREISEYADEGGKMLWFHVCVVDTVVQTKYLAWKSISLRDITLWHLDRSLGGIQ